jgi:magnesium chelatase family protein
MALPDGEPSAAVAVRVAAARQRQMARQGEPNALLEPARIDSFCQPDEAAGVSCATRPNAWAGAAGACTAA